MKKRSHFLLFLFSVTFLIVITVFWPKTPDVRLKLCQDVVRIFFHSPTHLTWIKHDAIMRGYEDLEIVVTYTLSQANEEVLHKQATCFFAYDQYEIEADTFATPSAAYSSYPNKIIIDGEQLPKNTLTELVKQAMIDQGRDIINKAKELTPKN